MKSKLTFAISLASAMAITGCSNPDDSTPGPQATAKAVVLAQAELDFLAEEASGQATVSKTDDTIVLNIEVDGLVPGPRGFHLHQTGVCDRPDFKSAGGHLNPLGNSHGSESEGGSHLGDLPNLVTANGETASITLDLPGDATQLTQWLFDADGTAIVIHEGPDDYKTDPSGAAGARIACGVLSKVSAAT